MRHCHPTHNGVSHKKLTFGRKALGFMIWNVKCLRLLAGKFLKLNKIGLWAGVLFWLAFPSVVEVSLVVVQISREGKTNGYNTFFGVRIT